jgi:hypothetical protein
VCETVKRFEASDERGMSPPFASTEVQDMLRELDSRMTPEGDSVTIWWDDETDDVRLVLEPASGEPCTVTVARERAGDAFRHPWTYVPVGVAA